MFIPVSRTTGHIKPPVVAITLNEQKSKAASLGSAALVAAHAIEIDRLAGQPSLYQRPFVSLL